MNAVSLSRGVGGLASHAAGSDIPDTVAATAVRRWTRTVFVASAAGNDAFAAHCAAFPYAAAVDHVRGFGKTAVSPWLPVTLEQAHGALRQCAREMADGLDAGTPGGTLDRWLPLILDVHGDAVSYDSYIGNPLLETVGATGAAVDELITALVADLTRYEALEHQHNPRPRQDKRTQAVLTALRRVRAIAPRASNAPEPGPAGRPDELSESARLLSAQVLAATSDDIRRLVDITMLPMTALHDEIMFVRSVQILDRLFAVLADAVREADKRAAEQDGESCAALLGAAADRVDGTAAMFRVLATMPRDVFAVLRMTTEGSSAIQSRAYRDFETTAAGLDPALLPRADRERVVAAMARLHHSWRALKRTHWGIAVKSIGGSPGTGGTSGVPYLRARMDQPLFPLLPKEDR